MSVLHPSVEVEVICADYFGDELVLPLPKVNNKMDSYKSSGKNTTARVAGKPRSKISWAFLSDLNISFELEPVGSQI